MEQKAEIIWILCEDCKDYRCVLHGKHVADCDCPSMEEMEFDPYTGRLMKTDV